MTRSIPEPLSPYRLGKARELYNIFNAFNAISWSFLTGNLILLFAMRLEVTSSYIGAVNAFLYMALFFLPLGKILARKLSIVKIFSFAWMARGIGMIPAIFVPFLASAGYMDAARNVLLLSVSLFHLFRGIGMVGNNPILSNLASGPDRGSYMTQIQIINSAVGMFCGFFIALILGRDPPLYLYTIIIILGIVTSIFSGILMRRIPEPPIAEEKEKVNFFSVVREAFVNDSLRQFLLIFFIVVFVSGISRNFMVVYSQRVFAQTDGMISLYSVFGGLGVLLVGLLIKFLVDHIGARPIFIICISVGLAGMLPVVFIPTGLTENLSTTILLLCLLFFIMNFSFLGAEGIAQTYFLGLVPKSMVLDMGILYFFILGIAGASGSFLAGLFLDLLASLNISMSVAFRILFIILIVLTIVVLLRQKKLVSLGALPIHSAMEVIFSFRDLSAITLLDKLNKSKDTKEEQALLGALQGTPSKLAVKGLLSRAKSPHLAVRTEALRAIEALETIDEKTEKALIEDTINSPFTTAYISARIIGKHKLFSAIPVLRELTNSDDYMLVGEAIIALAKLEDEVFRTTIENIILKTSNPRLKIMGVEAFGIYKSPNSLSVLLNLLKEPNPPPYMREEIFLAMSNILNTQERFYSLLIRSLEDEKLASALATDEAEAAYEYYRATNSSWFDRRKRSVAFSNTQAKALTPAVKAFIGTSNGALLSKWIHNLPEDLIHPITRMVLSEAILDNELNGYQQLRLLVVHWASNELRLWSNKVKKKLEK